MVVGASKAVDWLGSGSLCLYHLPDWIERRENKIRQCDRSGSMEWPSVLPAFCRVAFRLPHHCNTGSRMLEGRPLVAYCGWLILVSGNNYLYKKPGNRAHQNSKAIFARFLNLGSRLTVKTTVRQSYPLRTPTLVWYLRSPCSIPASVHQCGEGRVSIFRSLTLIA